MRHSTLLVPLALLALAWTPPALAAGDLDLGTAAVRFANSGPPEAQPAFQAGVAALHSFFYDEAADLFREAQRIAPDFALAYWGEAMTHNHPLWRQQDREAARAVLEGLAPTPEERAAKAPTEREKMLLAAVETLYGEGDKHQRDLAYEAALRRLTERFPDDPEVAAFYALALQGSHPGGPKMIPARMRSAAVLEGLFDGHPDHPGVLHYLIHAYDDPVHAPLGYRPARLYAEAAPAAPHALHMPSHIFVQLGLWQRVAASNEDAYAASVAWTERRGHPPDLQDFHSLAWLAYAYLELGRWADAGKALARMEEVAEETGARRVISYRDSTAARIVVETERWPELALPEEGAPPARVFAAGLSAARRGDLATARAAEARLAAEAEGSEGEGVAVTAKEMAALVRLVEGEMEQAVALAAEAARLEMAMDPPSGPPMPVKPAHELHGEILLAAGRAEAAREQFEVALERMPNRVLSLLGAARAAVALGRREEARERYRALAGFWGSADPGHPGAAEARGFLEGTAAGR